MLLETRSVEMLRTTSRLSLSRQSTGSYLSNRSLEPIKTFARVRSLLASRLWVLVSISISLEGFLMPIRPNLRQQTVVLIDVTLCWSKLTVRSSVFLGKRVERQSITSMALTDRLETRLNLSTDPSLKAALLGRPLTGSLPTYQLKTAPTEFS